MKQTNCGWINQAISEVESDKAEKIEASSSSLADHLSLNEWLAECNSETDAATELILISDQFHFWIDFLDSLPEMNQERNSRDST